MANVWGVNPEKFTGHRRPLSVFFNASESDRLKPMNFCHITES